MEELALLVCALPFDMVDALAPGASDEFNTDGVVVDAIDEEEDESMSMEFELALANANVLVSSRLMVLDGVKDARGEGWMRFSMDFLSIKRSPILD